MSRSRTQSLIWAAALIVAAGVWFALTLKVKAVNSRIAATEREILAVTQDRLALETEFQTRARQQQLVRWNEVEFGYAAPRAGQFLEASGELASLGRVFAAQAAPPVPQADGGDSGEGGAFAQPRFAVADAEAAPARVRQLVARKEPAEGFARSEAPRIAEPARHVASAPARTPAVSAAAAPASDFAERFDLDAVIARPQDRSR